MDLRGDAEGGEGRVVLPQEALPVRESRRRERERGRVVCERMGA